VRWSRIPGPEVVRRSNGAYHRPPLVRCQRSTTLYSISDRRHQKVSDRLTFRHSRGRQTLLVTYQVILSESKNVLVTMRQSNCGLRRDAAALNGPRAPHGAILRLSDLNRAITGAIVARIWSIGARLMARIWRENTYTTSQVGLHLPVTQRLCPPALWGQAAPGLTTGQDARFMVLLRGGLRRLTSLAEDYPKNRRNLRGLCLSHRTPSSLAWLTGFCRFKTHQDSKGGRGVVE